MNYDIVFEMQVKNKMNETNIEYIGIIGLFGRYNIEIPFDKQVNIFIGENGLGKTTILNCIYFLLEKKFTQLVNIQFSEIRVKFKRDAKLYKISIGDIREYGKSKRGRLHRYSIDSDIFDDELIENILFQYDDMEFDVDIERKADYLTYQLSQKLDIPRSFAQNQVRLYLSEHEVTGKNKRKANGNNVVELSKAISANVTQRIIYLPTYRRIEDDFASLNLRNEELNKAELLIRFGMSDVQNSIDRILEKIRSLAMKGFTEMTGVLLKQYADGIDPIDEINRKRKNFFDIETVKIVLDRVGKEIEEPYKNQILSLIANGKIKEKKYFYLFNLINKLIDNYDLQKAYDDRIKKFADTCNKYLNDKHFNYNQSTLSLKIYLDNEIDNRENRVIQLTQLSSGEKQIVSLFSRLYLESDERSIVIIDEPELSLSLHWQKMLLPDIMRTNNCDLLLTVTHSPFIFQNEFDYDAKEIRRYIETYR